MKTKRKYAQAAIASGNAQTSQAAADILRVGGNAADALVAGVVMSFFSESLFTSPAGGGFLMSYFSGQKPVVWDFFTQTPIYSKDPSVLDFKAIEVNFGEKIQEFHIGKGSIACPGVLHGLYEAHKKMGILPFKEIVNHTLNLAKEGLLITPFTAYGFRLLESMLFHNPVTRSVYFKEDILKSVGEKVYFPKSLHWLQSLTEMGWSDFYQGAYTLEMAALLKEGGLLCSEDFLEYRTIQRSPLFWKNNTMEIFTNPVPSLGGSILLKIIDAYERSTHTHSLSRLLDAQLQGDRFKYELGDQVLKKQSEGPYKGSTTHISIVDVWGNAMSCTTSSGEGSAVCLPNTEWLFNNMLGEDDLQPAGFHQWVPSRRLSSMMAPTMAFHGNELSMVTGSGGSSRIRTAISQVLIQRLFENKSPREAVEHERMHTEGLEVQMEHPSFDDEISVQYPSLRLNTWGRKDMFFGGTHSIFIEKGEPIAVGDSRRFGSAMQIDIP